MFVQKWGSLQFQWENDGTWLTWWSTIRLWGTHGLMGTLFSHLTLNPSQALHGNPAWTNCSTPKRARGASCSIDLRGVHETTGTSRVAKLGQKLDPFQRLERLGAPGPPIVLQELVHHVSSKDMGKGRKAQGTLLHLSVSVEFKCFPSCNVTQRCKIPHVSCHPIFRQYSHIHEE